MEVVPAILAENYNDLILRVRQAEAFAQYVQIDCMDGLFVPTKSVEPEAISLLKTSLSFELHLMVQTPSFFMDEVQNQGLKKVLFHFEADVDHPAFMKALNERGIRAGLAISPETRTADFVEAASLADTLLFLTVSPGRYGSPFKPEVLEKVKDARYRFPGKLIAVDGGVSLDNLKSFVNLGVDYVCVGSRIFLDKDPSENYRRFVEEVKRLSR